MSLNSLQPDTDPVGQLYEVARHGTLEEALLAQGLFTTGVECFVAIGKQCLRVTGSPAQMRDVYGEVISCREWLVSDPMLTEMELEWVRLDRAHGSTRRAVAGALILRAGMLCRILDRAFHHLEGRESGGDLLLRQPLIKARFVQSYSLAEQIRAEAAAYLNEAEALNLTQQHHVLSAETTKAAKLMGGHGFLLGEVNTLEIISLAMATVCREGAPITLPQLQAAAPQPRSVEVV